MNGLKTKREKLLVLGDFHAGTQEKSRELENKIREIMKLEKPTHVACTGDFDHPSMVLAWKKIAEELENEGVTVVTVAGNHDHANVKKMYITSGTLFKQNLVGNSSLIKAFEENDEARKYVEKLLEQPVKFIEFRGKRVIIMHSALNGNIPGNIPEEAIQYWYRLNTLNDYYENFLETIKQSRKSSKYRNWFLVVRGHDHRQEHASMQKPKTRQKIKPLATTSLKEIIKLGEIIRISPIERNEFDKSGCKPIALNKNCLHTITTGSFYEGNYAVITRENTDLKLTFKKLKL